MSKDLSRTNFFDILPRARLESARPSYIMDKPQLKLHANGGRNAASVAMTSEEYDQYIQQRNNAP